MRRRCEIVAETNHRGPENAISHIRYGARGDVVAPNRRHGADKEGARNKSKPLSAGWASESGNRKGLVSRIDRKLFVCIFLIRLQHAPADLLGG